MTNLTISKEQAIKLYPNASPEIKSIFESTFGKKAFSTKITDRIVNLDSVAEIVGILNIPFLRPATKEEKLANAAIVLTAITKAYNEGWTPNWRNHNEYKYFNYFYEDGGRWVACSDYWYRLAYCPSGLCFKSKELALDAMSKFRTYYEDFFMIN